MKRSLFFLLFVSLVTFQVSNSLTPFVEPFFFVSYIYLKKKYDKILVLSLDLIFAIGQLVVTLSNLQLAGFIFDGEDGGMYHYIIPRWINESFHVRFLGSWFFLLAYQLFSRPKSWIELKINNKGEIALFYLSILILVNRNLIGLPLIGSFGDLINWIPIASTYFLSRRAYLKRKQKVKIYAVLLMLINVGIAFLFATLRIEIIIAVIAYFMGIYWVKPRLSFFISYRFVIYYILGIIFILYFSAFGDIRNETTGLDRFTSLTLAKESQEINNTNEKNGAFQRAADLCQITNAIDLRKQNQIVQGETIEILGLALIPRFLWPSKPRIALGVWFALKIGMAEETSNGWFNNSINMTSVGQLYLEFGYYGVIIGMFLLGLFFSLMWRACEKLEVENNFLSVLFGSYLLITVFNFGTGPDLQLTITITALFLIMAFTTFIFRLKLK